jgi:site-specific recombinase XerD
MLDFEYRELRQFARNQRSKKAESTYRNIQSGLAKFEQYLKEELDSISLDEVGGRDIDQWVTWMVPDDEEEDWGEELAQTTAYEYLTAVRLFYDWYYLDEPTDNPARKVSTSWMDRDPVHPKPTLSQEEVRALVDSAETKRAEAMMGLMASTGMRIKEACLIESEQVDLDNRKIDDLTTVKTDYGDRTVYFSRKCRRLLDEYISDGYRMKYASGDSPYLFTSADYGQHGDDNGLSVDRAREDFKSAVANCGDIQDKVVYEETADSKIRCSVTSHILRRSFCQHWVDSGGDLMNLKNQVGWVSLETAKKYLNDDVDPDKVERYGLDL